MGLKRNKEFEAQRAAVARLLSTPDGQKFMELLERMYIHGEPDDRTEGAIREWLGARRLALDLKFITNERTGDT